MIQIIATAESAEQAQALAETGVNTLLVGEDEFGLRLPASFTLEEIGTLTNMAHHRGAKVCVAVNAVMHNDRIRKLPAYLLALRKIGVDAISVGDPGAVQVMRTHQIDIPYVYDAHTLVTNARQINFWTKRGAVGAVLARELTFEEIKAIAAQVSVPLEILVYGATCIHQSKRPLVDNYLQFTEQPRESKKGFFLSEPKQPDTHYSIYEDRNGTHIFATDDVNLVPYLGELAEAGLRVWKMDGIFTRGETFVNIAGLLAEARRAIEAGQWTAETAASLNERIKDLHPKERSLGEGFFTKQADDVQ